MERRYEIAGLPVAVRAATPGALDDLAPVYRTFATEAAPRLTIEVARVAGFDRERGPEYPAFRRTAGADGRLHVERYDAEGEIETSGRTEEERGEADEEPAGGGEGDEQES